ncbi:hypothetical protein [Bordetella sp. LUAb4]|uniref:hypothetical protein n=1 Tax=Bordetella sp. LUAb4 TaxID=2843195 RepID=UPI001E50A417|nr:hypothetical protein [Bordetella sp. LUAb4]
MFSGAFRRSHTTTAADDTAASNPAASTVNEGSPRAKQAKRGVQLPNQPVGVPTVSPGEHARTAVIHKANQDVVVFRDPFGNGNGGPANFDENFRAEDPVEVQADLDDAPAGVYRLGDSNKVFLKSNELSNLECLLRMMVSDSMVDETEIVEFCKQTPVIQGFYLRAVKCLEKGNPYCTAELLHQITNHDQRNLEIRKENRAVERNLLSEIEQGLKNKYDYFLFIRGDEHMLVHAVDVSAGTITYRSLPSAVWETKAPFLRKELACGTLTIDRYQDWSLHGLKSLPGNLRQRPSAMPEADMARTADQTGSRGNDNPRANTSPRLLALLAPPVKQTPVKLTAVEPDYPSPVNFVRTASMDDIAYRASAGDGNGAPANLAENFRAELPVKVYADYSKAPAGTYWIADSDRVFIKSDELSRLECLLRMMAGDNMADESEIVELCKQPPLLPRYPSADNWVESGTPYCTADLLHQISNHDQNNLEIRKQNRAAERNLLAEIEQGLKGKYDCFLFIRGQEHMLVYAANETAGTITYSAFPSAVCETKAPFLRKALVDNQFITDIYQDWSLYGLNSLPVTLPLRLPVKPDASPVPVAQRTATHGNDDSGPGTSAGPLASLPTSALPTPALSTSALSTSTLPTPLLPTPELPAFLLPTSVLNRGDNFRAVHPLAVHADFRDAPSGIYSIADSTRMFFKSDTLSPVECLLRMMVSDNMADKNEIAELFEQAPSLSVRPSATATMKWLQEGTPYGTADLLYKVDNVGVSNSEILDRNRAIEANLLPVIEDGIRSGKYDYFLFFTGVAFREATLIHGADWRGGTFTGRLLPSATCETRAPFKQWTPGRGTGALQDWHEDWTLYGLKSLPNSSQQLPGKAEFNNLMNAMSERIAQMNARTASIKSRFAPPAASNRDQ